MKIKVALSGLLVAGMIVSGEAQATLFDRGSGLLYDDVLNVTWLQDANYARTSGYDSDGRMTWVDTANWVGSLVYEGISGWRLPSTSPVNGTGWNFNGGINGLTDSSVNVTSKNNELAYMFYVNLGLKGFVSPTGVYAADAGVLRNSSSWGEADIGLVKNMQNLAYWTGTDYPLSTGSAFYFRTDSGYQNDTGKTDQLFAWAVRDGDVASIPEPTSLVLLGLALGGLAVSRRKRSKVA